MTKRTKTPKFAIAPEGKYLDITPRKKYKILWRGKEEFYITDDEGDSRFCLTGKCAQINNNRWILK